MSGHTTTRGVLTIARGTTIVLPETASHSWTLLGPDGQRVRLTGPARAKLLRALQADQQEADAALPLIPDAPEVIVEADERMTGSGLFREI